jgi:hypothetical protein
LKKHFYFCAISPSGVATGEGAGKCLPPFLKNLGTTTFFYLFGFSLLLFSSYLFPLLLFLRYYFEINLCKIGEKVIGEKSKRENKGGKSHSAKIWMFSHLILTFFEKFEVHPPPLILIIFWKSAPKDLSIVLISNLFFRKRVCLDFYCDFWRFHLVQHFFKAYIKNLRKVDQSTDFKIGNARN